jgi:hypothetical protein
MEAGRFPCSQCHLLVVKVNSGGNGGQKQVGVFVGRVESRSSQLLLLSLCLQVQCGDLPTLIGVLRVRLGGQGAGC